MSYFTLENMCKHLELQKVYQTSQMLSKLTVDDIIGETDLDMPNSKLKQFIEESVTLIPLKTHKNIKAVPSNKIKKYVLSFLLNYYYLNCFCFYLLN